MSLKGGKTIEDSWEALQESVRVLDKARKDANLNINIAKTMTLLSYLERQK